MNGLIWRINWVGEGGLVSSVLFFFGFTSIATIRLNKTFNSLARYWFFAKTRLVGGQSSAGRYSFCIKCNFPVPTMN